MILAQIRNLQNLLLDKNCILSGLVHSMKTIIQIEQQMRILAVIFKTFLCQMIQMQ